jgi:hypothetical protein
MKSEPLVLSYDNLVIGSSLEALLYAYYNRYNIVWTRNESPYAFERLRKDFGLGIDKYSIWTRHAFLLGIGGFSAFGDNIKSIYFQPNNKLRLSSIEDYKYIVHYKKLHIFSDHELYDGQISYTSSNDKVKIIDWFHPTCLQTKKMGDCYFREDRLLNETYFYPSFKNKKIATISYCSNDELQKDVIPIYLVKIRLLEHIVKLGARKTDDSKIVHENREIINLEKMVYESTNDIEYIYDTAEEIHNKYSKKSLDYIRYIELRTGI